MSITQWLACHGFVSRMIEHDRKNEHDSGISCHGVMSRLIERDKYASNAPWYEA